MIERTGPKTAPQSTISTDTQSADSSNTDIPYQVPTVSAFLSLKNLK